MFVSLMIALFITSCASTHTYDFRVVNRDCNCSKYTIRDAKNRIAYEFTANYSLDDEMLTTITVRIENRSRNTLTFDQARVRVSSKRFGYQYNDKFLPFNPIKINPGESQEMSLVGRADVKEKDEWHLIAGEKMTVTIRGIRSGEDELSLEDVEFVPVNPKLADD